MNSGALLGFFPNLDADRFGGVELSGRLAWQAVCEQMAAQYPTPTLFCYGARPDGKPANDERILARSKTNAIWRALRVRVKPRVVLVWHLGLLKLVPWLRAPRARVIVFLHGIEAWRAQDRLTQLLLPRVQLFLSNSHYTYARFMETQSNLTQIASQVVPLGADIPDPVVAEPVSPPRMLMVSRLERGEDYKGHREVIGAWERVRARIPDAELWIAGDGNLHAALETVTAELHLQQSVRFLGQITDIYKNQLLRESRALAMPSRGEGFGLAYVEAMRAGRPCLVSDCDAGREVVNPPNAGLAVAPNDVGALANAAVRLLTPGVEWTNWSQQARARYQANYTAAHFQRRLVTALVQLRTETG